LKKDRSAHSVVQSSLDIKQWLQRLPTVAEVRPGRCPCCGAPSCPVGGTIQLHGHGTRERQVAGPCAPDAPPETVTVLGRRYRCVPCGGVIIVVPREIRGRRVYSMAAIALALALWGLVQATAAAVRAKVCPAKRVGFAAASGWATLQRWARDVANGRLFGSSPKLAAPIPLRRIAAIAAGALAANAEPATRDQPIEHRAFFGAAHAA
jgi:hypothetical protein